METLAASKEYSAIILFVLGVFVFANYLAYGWCKQRGTPGRYFVSLVNMTEQANLIKEIVQQEGGAVSAKMAAFLIVWWAILFFVF